MRFREPSHRILPPFHPDEALMTIERAGRKCYKSSSEITPATSKRFVERLLRRGHLSVLEHATLSVEFVLDRGVSHELVRHRLCAFSQESTHYINYGKDDELDMIRPFFFDPMEEGRLMEVPDPSTVIRAGHGRKFTGKGIICLLNAFDVWFLACLYSEWAYMTLTNEFKRLPSEARSVLPCSMKTEIVVTANLREWRHIFSLRCAKTAHPQMSQLMTPLRDELRRMLPGVFELKDNHEEEVEESVDDMR